MKQTIQIVIEQLEKGKDMALTTLIAGIGSTPRGAGTHMWASSDGSSGGTIGGGMVEHKASLKAVEALEHKTSILQEYNLGSNDAASIGMICGGSVAAYCQYISHKDAKTLDLFKQMKEALGEDEKAWFILDITETSEWKMGLYTEKSGLFGLDICEVKEMLKNKAGEMKVGERCYYIEPIIKAGIVYVFGGGHVSQALVPVLTNLDFTCVVFDDREEFANAKRFPSAKETHVGEFTNIGNYINITKHDYVIVMTKGHKGDYDVQAHALSKKPFYIGVMGSKAKLGNNAKILMEKGFTKEEIDKCHMPIGLAIHAETPEELAISVAGELIMLRATRGLESL
jgi:Xanthine and CO dehydrogenases maturation factor, XdhC/CoxF family